MDPRRLAAACAVVAALLVAGCLGGSGGGADLRVTEIDGDWTGDGTLEVAVTVLNTGSAEATGAVVARVDVDGGETYTARREVAVAASTTETVVVVFEPPAASVGAGFDASAWME